MRGDVHHQPQTRQRGTPVQPAHQIGWQRHRLQRHRQRQLSWVKIERLALVENDLIAHHAVKRGAHFIFGTAQIDKRCRVTTEGTKFIAQAYIHRRAVNTLHWRTWVDRQTAFIKPGFNISVTQTHGIFSFRASLP
ncbi:Uncharacterised protein [Shigella sonnei]|nr:Uncharacterised protein [Shigella sonnei]CST41999.1 Uncharacterised protein [Shigella sonnei]